MAMYLMLKSSTTDFFFRDAGVLIQAAGSVFPDPTIIQTLSKSSDLRARVQAGTVIVNNGADLSVADGLKYLEQLWLMSGNDTAPQFTQVEGSISDLQHGSRGAGTLHPAATAVAPGFMSAADKAKLDGVFPKAHNNISLSFGSSTGAGVTQTGAAYLASRYLYFAGTAHFGTPTGLRIVAQRSSGTDNCIVRIVDVGTGLTVAAINTITAGTPTIYTQNTLANLSAAETIWRLDISGGGAGTKIELFSLDLD